MPIRRAIQRDEDASRRWREEVWPELRQRARRERRVLIFEDESGFYLLPGLVRTGLLPKKWSTCYDSLWDPKRVRRRTMRTRHKPEQVILKLRQAEAELAAGTTMAQVCQQMGVSETTFNRWHLRQGGMKADEAWRLKELEAENARLKRLVAELSLDRQMPQEVAQKKW